MFFLVIPDANLDPMKLLSNQKFVLETNSEFFKHILIGLGMGCLWVGRLVLLVAWKA